jgi:histidyl-tRNA synthetase
MATKPSIPSGTRDFGPSEVARRQYIIDAIREVYHLYGFQPLETPVMENLSTLLGKYGEEGDKLVYRILNSGDFLKKADDADLQTRNTQKLSAVVSEKGLRYDLTVPFARYVVMHQHELNFPFRRYQIQPVWRADRPQKGRYREFYQCDADVIGSNSLLLDAELVLMIRDVFEKLKLNVTIRLNNRKILDGLAHYANCEAVFNQMVVILDKADKIGTEGVQNELSTLGLNEEQIGRISAYLNCTGTNQEKLQYLGTIMQNDKGRKGLEELTELMDRVAEYWSDHVRVEVDLTLARGLSYYTGTIYETVSRDVQMGSILGGGRYDDLTGIFGLPNMSGVGISFGLDRIYDILNELQAYPANIMRGSDVVFIPFDTTCEKAALHYADEFRHAQLRTEVYPDLNAKLAKKFKYADGKGIRFAVLIGEDEFNGGFLTVKDLQTGEQQPYKLASAIDMIKAKKQQG